MTVRVIDIETTGTDPTVDVIIEIGSVDLLKDGTITNQRSTLVRPDAYVVHNADFERSFLERLLGDALWACTYKCALRIWPDLLSHSNQALRYRLGLVDPFNIDRHTLSPHRALSDAIVTAAVFKEITKHATWPELVRWSSEPALLSVFRFGKHRGRALRRGAGGLPHVDRRGAERTARGGEGLGAVLAR